MTLSVDVTWPVRQTPEVTTRCPRCGRPIPVSEVRIYADPRKDAAGNPLHDVSATCPHCPWQYCQAATPGQIRRMGFAP